MPSYMLQHIYTHHTVEQEPGPNIVVCGDTFEVATFLSDLLCLYHHQVSQLMYSGQSSVGAICSFVWEAADESTIDVGEEILRIRIRRDAFPEVLHRVLAVAVANGYIFLEDKAGFSLNAPSIIVSSDPKTL